MYQFHFEFILLGLFIKINSKKKTMHKDKQVIYKLKCISVISLIFMTVQILGGIMAHSIAILADAFHLLSDVMAYIISLQAVLMSHRKPPFFMTFGYEKIQPLGALVNIAIIWFVTIQLVIQATERIVNKSVVHDPLYMLITSFFGLGCNLYIMKVLHADTEHGGHQGCSHAHGLQHHHQHKEGQQCNHNHSHHSHSHDDHDHSKRQIRGSNHGQDQKNSSQGQYGHNHNHGNQTHDHHNHQGHNHGHNCSHHGTHISSPTDSSRQINCDKNHDHYLDAVNCRPSNLMNKQNEPINVNQHISYKPEVQINLSDENLEIAQKQRARNQLFQNINIQAAHIHIISDIILSIGVIISAIVIFFKADPNNWTFWQLADPLCTYLFSIMAIYSTIGIAKDSIIILLDGCDSPDMLKQIISELDSMDQIQKYEQLRVWSLNRAKFAAAIKIYLTKDNFQDIVSRDEIKKKVIAIFSMRKISYYVQVLEDKESENGNDEQKRLKSIMVENN